MGRTQDRPFDLVLLGATGYTGGLVAHHLAASGEPLRWAIAGRAPQKLAALAADLAQATPQATPPQTLVVDATCRADMERLAQATRVVCTTAGPFAQIGSELVAACAAAGTDYCDITGELQWVRKMIDAHHERALASGARLVHFCGFDSIPSDLGTWALQQEMIARTGAPARSVTAYVSELRGSLSGGTAASILAFLDAAQADRQAARLLAAPYSLNPDPSYRGPDRGDLRAVAYDRTRSALTMPFLMAPTNTRVVRRSHALAGFPWGHDFRYAEMATAPVSLAGLAQTLGMTAGLAALLVAAAQPQLRKLLQKRLPRPGEGPSREERARGRYKVTLVGRRDEHQLTFVVSDQADPGYGSTSKMLAQAALCLALDPLAPCSGSLTPSTAMAVPLLARLRAAGLTFAIPVLASP